MPKSLFQKFKTSISGISLPEKFTFPFYYEPHELSQVAVLELQSYLETQTDFEHNFGLQKDQDGLVIGKMFGVLVCQNQKGELGYLWAFSGKLAEQNQLPYFVPTVYDMLHPSSFYKNEEAKINQLNRQIEQLEENSEYLMAKETLNQIFSEAENDIQRQKQHIKTQKLLRDQLRIDAQNTKTIEEFEAYNLQLSEQSKREAILLKKMTKYWNYKKAEVQQNLESIEAEINQLKEKRREMSGTLQQRLFAEYSFLNQSGKRKSIGEIFNDNPPAGAGECAAPKLLHYAFEHQLRPIAMAEFWWGQSPRSEVRKHKQFYPACKGKCEPILLGHMLDDIIMDENPFLENPAEGKTLEIIYEDDVMLAINKPAEFLSVPGKLVTDSVYERIKQMYPDATGPLVVHRLDMSTSGIMLLAKNEETYVQLQSQFIKRKVKKCYEALLDGVIEQNEGFIDLPLRVDLDDRPRQMVCYEYGKPAQTEWEKIAIENNKTRVHFYPITGRTHQLRVHASHPLGLNTSITGDDLYGTKSNRLHLHAKSITFEHPISKEVITLLVEADF
ncbi:RluA family pseudouridine synthase [Flavobacterium sp. H122]|uniref:RluA family pseudouridine synthase n=1 Tax=Flavobacterium sp. H122 TaxID=2529860 RepID=UPI0010A9E18B|nr:RluA family pseudouridine synthase [Flavobacterium sp. H122]